MNCIKKIKLKNRNIRNKSDYTKSYYLLGIISIYLLCEILKSSSLIKEGKYNYKKGDFQDFVYNLLISLFLIYSLIHKIIKDTEFNYSYWIVSHISSICFALLNKIKILQFSLDSEKKYSEIQDYIIIITTIIIVLLCIRQIYNCNVKYYLIFRFILIYFMIFLLFLSKTAKINFHIHQ